ncbi:acetate uptake transporter [Pseudonocardia xinjiangensis]|uniref:acetate uptake transporter n=1 Tax=Pseudonocardia xinjiangensis TaxID=75289 RepID=UPI003D940582
MSADISGLSVWFATPEYRFWRDRTTIALLPVAAPSILGLFGFAASTFMVAASLAGWYGNAEAPLILFPFALAAGGIAQLLAGMWAYRAQDAVATALHSMWGLFWIGYGLYTLLIALGVVPATSSAAAVAFGVWFVVLAAITWLGAVAAATENIALTAVLGTLATGSTLLAIALLRDVPVVQTIGAYVLLVSAALACYLAAAMMLEATAKRVVLPIGKRRTARLPGTVQRNVLVPGVTVAG